MSIKEMVIFRHVSLRSNVVSIFFQRCLRFTSHFHVPCRFQWAAQWSLKRSKQLKEKQLLWIDFHLRWWFCAHDERRQQRGGVPRALITNNPSLLLKHFAQFSLIDRHRVDLFLCNFQFPYSHFTFFRARLRRVAGVPSQSVLRCSVSLCEVQVCFFINISIESCELAISPFFSLFALISIHTISGWTISTSSRLLCWLCRCFFFSFNLFCQLTHSTRSREISFLSFCRVGPDLLPIISQASRTLYSNSTRSNATHSIHLAMGRVRVKEFY